MQNTKLYQAIESFDPPANFLNRLRRENSWTLRFTRRAFSEYKRFLYLAMISPQPVTPSEEIDQVWHLHLLYTRSYWDDLCQNILGSPLHHGPTAGGSEEDEKFENWYERTKALYTEEFNEAPSVEFWPASEIRFDPKQRSYWRIPKPSWQATLPSTLAFFLVASGVGPAVVVLAVLTAFFLLWALIRAAVKSQSSRQANDSGAEVYAGDLASHSSDCGNTDAGCGDSGSGCGSSGCGGGGCGGGS